MLDRKIIPAVQEELLSKKWLRHMERHMRAHLERRLSELADADARVQAERRLTKVKAELKHVADAVAEIGWHETLKEKLDELTEEKKRLGFRLAAAKINPRLAVDISSLLPALMENNMRTVLQFSGLKSKSPHATAKARTALQKLTGRIELKPTGQKNDRLVAKLELTGERIQLLSEEAMNSQSQEKQLYIKMVAGARFVH